MNRSVLSFENLCRFCAKTSFDMEPLFINKENERLIDMVNNLLPFKITLFDDLPQQSCEACLALLKQCKQFSDQCIEANEELKSLSSKFCKIEIQTEELNSSNSCNALEDKELQINQSFSDSNDDSEKYCSVCHEKFHDTCEVQANDKCKKCRVYQSHSGDPPDSSSKTTRQLPAQSCLCDLCGKVFKHPNNLRAHRATHLDEDLKKKHVCASCGKRFQSRFQLNDHNNIHLDLRPYACDLCDKKFHKRILLRQHNLTHLSESELLECPKCGLRFNRKGNLIAHLRTHENAPSFTCRICSLSFETMHSLLSHRRLDHPLNKAEDSKANKKFLCAMCKKYFKSLESFIAHLETHEQKEVQKEECPTCHKVLMSKASLKYHQMSKHSDLRPYRCTYCSNNSKTVAFMSLTLLKNHERLHTGQKPFKCDTCDKSFRSGQSLRQHKLKHSNQWNFQCNHCWKLFKTRGSLKVHLKIHTGERPFVCDRCGQGFIQKSDMLKHRGRHSNTDPLGDPNKNATVEPPSLFYDSSTGDFNKLDAATLTQQVLALSSNAILPDDTLIYATNQLSASQCSNSDSKSITVDVLRSNFGESLRQKVNVCIRSTIDPVGTPAEPSG